MKIRQWKNKLGCDVTIKGRTWECGKGSDLQWHASRRQGDIEWNGKGPNFLQAIANAKPAAI